MSLNITGVNYYQNGIDITQPQDGGSNEQLQINLPKGLTSHEAGLELLMRLNPGDSFNGEITNITGNQITLALSDTVNITATLSDALSYNIGDKASFAIKSNDSDRIVLKTLTPSSAENLMNDQGIKNVLNNAKLAVTETTVSLVNNLMKYNMPVDSNSLNNYMRMLDIVPNASVNDVVMMSKMDIPITPENINAFHDYNDFSEGITARTVELSDNTIKNLIDNPELIKPFLDSFSEEISSVEPLPSKEALIKVINDVLIDVTNEVMSDEQQPINTLTHLLDKNDTTSKEFLQEFSKLIEKNEVPSDKLKNIIQSKEFKAVIDNFIRQEVFLKPEDISKENIKKLYSKLLSDTNGLSDNITHAGKGLEIASSAQNLANDITFLNDVNQFMNFVQVPLKMFGKNAHGDLYVQTRNHGKTIDKDELKALLHLDMDNLGPMDIYVTLNKQKVNTNFKVSDESILDYIEAHIDELNTRLSKLGYSVNTNIEVNDGKYGFKKSILDNEFPPNEIRRFAFDVRA